MNLLLEVVLLVDYYQGCPDLEDIEIEDYNFMDVTSFTLDATMRSLKNLVLGASAFGSCTNLTLRGLYTEGC